MPGLVNEYFVMLGGKYRLTAEFGAVIGIQQSYSRLESRGLVLLIEVESVILLRALCRGGTLPTPKNIYRLKVTFRVLWIVVVKRAGELVRGGSSAVEGIVKVVERGLTVVSSTFSLSYSAIMAVTLLSLQR